MKEKKLDVNPGLGTKIICKDKVYTHEDIKKKMNVIKSIFRYMKIEKNSSIGLILERSEWQIICPISVLNYNCAYIPLNILWPVKRILKILNHTDPSIVIIDKKFYDENKESVKDYQCKVVYENIVVLAKNGHKKNVIENVAYIIFTSGTTGDPKGVVISRSALQRFKENFENRILLKKGKSILSLAEYSFDMFVPEGILALSWGLNVILAEAMDIINPRRIEKMLLEYKPDYMQITPSALDLILTVDKKLYCLTSISKLIVGAERFPEDLFVKIKERYKGNLYNFYGPTEATVWCCGGDISEDKYVNIGSELGDCKISIISESIEVKEKCGKGEICISGEQLAEGYWNDEEETKKKFYFVKGKRYYRSGDIGYKDNEGNIICLGRKDDQIKRHGYRIELAEIENISRKARGVKNALVTTAGKSEEKLICFLIVSDEFRESDFREHLEKNLPVYELPERLFLVNEFTYSENGKINRKKMIEKVEGFYNEKF